MAHGPMGALLAWLVFPATRSPKPVLERPQWHETVGTIRATVASRAARMSIVIQCMPCHSRRLKHDKDIGVCVSSAKSHREVLRSGRGATSAGLVRR